MKHQLKLEQMLTKYDLILIFYLHIPSFFFFQVFYDLMRDVRRRKGGPLSGNGSIVDPGNPDRKRRSARRSWKKHCNVL